MKKHLWMDLGDINFPRIIDELRDSGLEINSIWSVWLAVVKVYPAFARDDVAVYYEDAILAPSVFTEICFMMDSIGYELGLSEYFSTGERLRLVPHQATPAN